MIDQALIGVYRLFSQRIAPLAHDTPEAVVSWMGAMQAQDYGQAVWAIGVRIPGGTLQTVEAAIEAGTILRTWPQRGTIHFVPAENAKWMVQLGGERMVAKDARRQAQLGLDADQLTRCRALAEKALAGRKRFTRAEMLQVFTEGGVPMDAPRGYHTLGYLAWMGVLCIGPLRAKEQTFVLLEDWVPNLRRLTHDEALTALAAQYFTSHAPATVYDFAWWAGLTLTEARAGLAGSQSKFVSETIGKKTYWMPNDFTPPTVESSVVLLPGYDEFFLGYQDRGDVLLAEHAQKVVPGNNGVFSPMIVIDGQIVGTWKRAIKPKKITITRDTFRPLTDAETAAFESAARRYGEFHHLSVEITHHVTE